MGGFRNGGQWRFDSPVGSLFVKRTGAAFLGDDPVWRLSSEPSAPVWWGREAAFYASDLATDGWGVDCSAAECLAIDEGPGQLDLWLEYVDGIPLPVDRYEDAVVGLARWQARHSRSESRVLSRGWLSDHLSRRRLSNATTAAHAGWAVLREVGLGDAAQRWASERVTDPRVADALLARLPHLPAHHDFHHMNIGSVGERIVVIDWASVGWGPVGHDVGNLVLDRASDGDVDVAELWSRLLGAYGAELRRRGVAVDQATVEDSAAISVAIRLGWTLDFLLELSGEHPPETLAGLIAVTDFLAVRAVGGSPIR